MILAFLADKCYEKGDGSEHRRLRATCTWAAAEMIHVMDSAARFFSKSETGRFDYASDLFLTTYQALAASCQASGVCNWKFRPKLHDLCEIIVSSVEAGINHRHRSCFADEDLMGKVARVGKQTHRATFALRFLQRHLMLLAVRWSQRARSGLWTVS